MSLDRNIDETRLWGPLLVIVLNGIIAVFLLLALVPAVFDLYDRGYGRFSAVLEYALIPFAGFIVSAGVPVWLCWLGKRRVALNLATVCLVFFWVPYLLFIMKAAAI